ncbi:MAG: riboflavin synthase [Fimbriimonadaceae bacterium]|nr:riboflavin synthase [Fimbriimonadaceae bacterium]
MFTGLIQGVGRVISHDKGRLMVDARDFWPGDPILVGESIAVNGVCLTAVTSDLSALVFDLSDETYARSALGDLMPGRLVNLERAMKLGDRLGGHIVQGHVDVTGEIVRVSAGDEGMATVVVQAPSSAARYLVDKGSVTVDGISLTVVNPQDSGRFELAIIPHTWEHTTLHDVAVGQRVNLEYDILAKHVERLLRFSPPTS